MIDTIFFLTVLILYVGDWFFNDASIDAGWTLVLIVGFYLSFISYQVAKR